MTSIIALLFLSLLNPIAAFAMAQEIDLPIEESVAELSKKEKLITWLHTNHTPGHLNDEEHHVPVFLQFRPTRVELPFGYKLPDEFVVVNDQLELRALTPQILQRLSTGELKKLLSFLSTVEVELQYSDAEGHIKSGKKHLIRKSKTWEKSNAASALALTMAMQSQIDLFVTMTALVPDAIIPSIHGTMFGVINPTIMSQIIANMLLQLDGDEVGVAYPMAKQISTLIERGLVYWVGKDVRLFNTYLSTILAHTTPIIDQNSTDVREQRLGMLIGSVLAGIMHHVDSIKKTDDKRIWIIGLIANLAWAATTFIGCAPIATPIAAGLAGSLSVGAVISTAIMTALQFPRDYAPTTMEMEGKLYMGFLEASRKKGLEEKVNLLFMFEWIQAAIHSNGLHN